jgi:hypothetical protein
LSISTVVIPTEPVFSPASMFKPLSWARVSACAR